MKVLITGIAGFIGFHLAQAMKDSGWTVIGIDNYNNFLYNSDIKYKRAEILNNLSITVIAADIRNKNHLRHVFHNDDFDLVIHLAAHAGVRHSLDHASAYIETNIVGTQNVIDVCKSHNINKVIYASTSCTMAGNDLPWKEDQPTYDQLNPYGYTKKTNESQFKSSGLSTIGLRFFTVYGPWGRPDMALWQFTKSILNDTPIDLYNAGDMVRDFTYVSDVVEGILIISKRIINNDVSEIYNIGYGEQVPLTDFVHEIEYNLSKKAIVNLVDKHPADTQSTWADNTKIRSLGWIPSTSVKDGIKQFVNWFKEYE
tara:strand:+ start:473 stop:1411 length:939 start_codon:yes stop_codon:yes gene_type:complete